ncbi:transposase [Gammaproteobacteria bacterium]
MKEETIRSAKEQLVNQVTGLLAGMEESIRTGQPVHETEQFLWDKLMIMGHKLLEVFFALCVGDEGELVMLPDGRQVRRLKTLHPKRYVSIFGSFDLERVVYGTREGQKIEYAPLDRRCGLPEGVFSYLLQDWEQSLAQEMPFAQVSATLAKILGFKQSVNSLERMDRDMAEAADAFWEAQPTPAADKEGELLVITADGKGVPMRKTTASMETAAGQSATPSPDPGKPKPGITPGTKKMALLGAVYTVDRFPRTPEQVIESLFRSPSSATNPVPKRAEPQFKRVRAELLRDEAGTTAPQVEKIFGWLAQEATSRNPDGKKPILHLMDGQESLWDAGLEYLPEDRFKVTEILDLFHVLTYLWEAVHLFHPNGSPEASRFVRTLLDQILHGAVESVISTLRRKGEEELRGQSVAVLERILGYFRNNAHRMIYDEYLAAGYPIASGVIEGACRCVVKDRMERSGMRWVLDGARAMLNLRSISLSGLWEPFTQFRIHRELQRIYPYAPANDENKTLLLAA